MLLPESRLRKLTATTPKRMCAEPGCSALVDRGRCAQHTREFEQRRGSAHQRGYTSKWSRASRAFLLRNPLCADPFKIHGIGVPAECTDHIRDHHGDLDLFWDSSNWQPLCLSCNTRKAQQGRVG